MSDSQKWLRDFFNDEMVLLLRTELGIQNDSEEAQTKVLAALGNIIFNRVMLEVAKKIPNTAQEECHQLIGSEKYDELHRLLTKHIPELDTFIENAAKEEMRTIIARAKELSAK